MGHPVSVSVVPEGATHLLVGHVGLLFGLAPRLRHQLRLQHDELAVRAVRPELPPDDAPPPRVSQL